jgi:hypothetical protein
MSKIHRGKKKVDEKEQKTETKMSSTLSSPLSFTLFPFLVIFACNNTLRHHFAAPLKQKTERKSGDSLSPFAATTASFEFVKVSSSERSSAAVR